MAEGGSSWAEQSNANAVKFAHEILRTLVVVNGGATIAMLSFIGGAVGDGHLTGDGPTTLARPLMCFGWGIVITLAAMVGAYFTEGLTTLHAQEVEYAPDSPDAKTVALISKLGRRKVIVHVIAISLTTASVGAFLTGMYQLEASMEAAFKPLDAAAQVSKPNCIPPTNKGKPLQRAPS